MEFLEFTQESESYVIAEFFKAQVLSKMRFAMTEKYPTLHVMKALSD
jgi:hypothetical protein